MDKEFLSRLKSGDPHAFESLVAQFQGKVLNICYRFLRNKEDAEDTAQDVFVDVYRSLSGFREEAELSSWIYRIAVTKSLDVLRKKKRKKRLGEGRGIFPALIDVETVPGAAAADPACLLEAQERVLALQRAVASLTERQRIAITLSKYEGFGNQEIAAIMETTLISVESLIHRAHDNLRGKLSTYYARQIKTGGENGPQV